MLDTHPQTGQVARELLAACVEACFECAQTCTVCADACLGEDNIEMMVSCIRSDLDCAAVCLATGQLAARQTNTNWTVLRAQLTACAAACRACGDECEQHAGMHEHCRVCAQSCRDWEEACNQLLDALPQA